MRVDEAIRARKSVRAFLPDPVPEATLRELLALAARAPSGTNTQPWRVYVVTGEVKAAISRDILAAFDDPAAAATHRPEYDYYPTEWRSPYIDRRRKVGWDLYGLLGIAKGDKPRMHAQHARNFMFFDAPVGLVFSIDNIMQRGSWLDYGMFIQNLMLAAVGEGLATCPQFALTQYHRIIRPQVGMPDHEVMVCGMSLGYPDNSAVENTLVTERAPVDEWVRFL